MRASRPSEFLRDDRLGSISRPNFRSPRKEPVEHDITIICQHSSRGIGSQEASRRCNIWRSSWGELLCPAPRETTVHERSCDRPSVCQQHFVKINGNKRWVSQTVHFQNLPSHIRRTDIGFAIAGTAQRCVTLKACRDECLSPLRS